MRFMLSQYIILINNVGKQSNGKDFKNDPNWRIHNKENLSMSHIQMWCISKNTEKRSKNSSLGHSVGDWLNCFSSSSEHKMFAVLFKSQLLLKCSSKKFLEGYKNRLSAFHCIIWGRVTSAVMIFRDDLIAGSGISDVWAVPLQVNLHYCHWFQCLHFTMFSHSCRVLSKWMKLEFND